jgi:hypothetical protein
MRSFSLDVTNGFEVFLILAHNVMSTKFSPELIGIELS